MLFGKLLNADKEERAKMALLERQLEAYKDSAEFTERVARLLASWVAETSEGVCGFPGGTRGMCTGCGACVLYNARLEIEEEMQA